jgi:3-oxoacyl-[acyl-carrier protein] reductase
MGGLEGKVAIVTGAGRGVGRCHALELARHGALVVVNDLGPAADDVAAEINEAGGTAIAHRCNVSEWAAAGGLVDHALDAFGDLHVLVTNAGFIRDAMSFSLDEQQWDSVVDVHLKGHMAPIRFAASVWREQAKRAAGDAPLTPRRIITTTSESGLFGGPGQSNYAAAKGGIVSMTLVLARELGRYGVTVNCIAPRARTPMTEANPKFAKPETGFDKYDPANVSPIVAWLASDDAADVSGQVFIVLGDQVHRIRPVEIADSIVADGRPWTLDALSEARSELFSSVPPGVPAWGGPPM